MCLQALSSFHFLRALLSTNKTECRFLSLYQSCEKNIIKELSCLERPH